MDQEAVLLRQAQQAIRQGQRGNARRMLQQLLQQNPRQVAAWLLLASVTANPQTALRYVLRAEALNPTSPTVQKAKAWATARMAEAGTASALASVVAQAAAETGSQKRPFLRWGVVGAAAVLLLLLVVGAWRLAAPPQAEAEVRGVAFTPSPAWALAAQGGEDRLIAAEATAVSQLPPQPETPAPSPLSTATPTTAALLPKPISLQNQGPRATWTLTPTPTPTPTPTNTPVPTFVAEQRGPVTRPFGVGAKERWIDVNLTTQTLTAYEGDVPLLTTLISSGLWRTPTVTGQFRIYLTYTSQTMDGRRLGYDYYLENVPYVMYFYKDYALHGTFWHNNFGTPMSHGCVNMRTSDAEWLFYWASIGTLVNVHY